MSRTTLLFIAISAGVLSCATAKDDPATSQGHLGRIARSIGTPILKRIPTGRAAKAGIEVLHGDVLKTRATDKIFLELGDESKLAVGPLTQVKLSAATPTGTKQHMTVAFETGSFWLKATSSTETSRGTIQVRTPLVTARMHDAVLWGSLEQDLLCALEGSVEVRTHDTDGSALIVDQGQCATGLHQGLHESPVPMPKAIDAFLKEVLIQS